MFILTHSSLSHILCYALLQLRYYTHPNIKLIAFPLSIIFLLVFWIISHEQILSNFLCSQISLADIANLNGILAGGGRGGKNSYVSISVPSTWHRTHCTIIR